jgi:hypothetical protein
MMHTYQKNKGKTRQENTGEEFWGNRRHQRSNMTMAASLRRLWYEEKPSNIGRNTIADQGELGGYKDGRKGRKAAAAAARMAL